MDISKHYFEVNITDNSINLMPITFLSFIFMYLFTSQISLRYLDDNFFFFLLNYNAHLT